MCLGAFDSKSQKSRPTTCLAGPHACTCTVTQSRQKIPTHIYNTSKYTDKTPPYINHDKSLLTIFPTTWTVKLNKLYQKPPTKTMHKIVKFLTVSNYATNSQPHCTCTFLTEKYNNPVLYFATHSSTRHAIALGHSLLCWGQIINECRLLSRLPHTKYLRVQLGSITRGRVYPKKPLMWGGA